MSAVEMDWEVDRVPSGPVILPIPASIAAAIIAVKRKVKTLPKTSANAYSNYNYASADAFMEAISPLEAEVGLTIIQQQSGWELRKVGSDTRPRFVLFIEYHFYLVHESGEMWATPLVRTVNVDAAGAQAWGAAATYALKQFQRSLYQVPTGEADADDMEGAKLSAGNIRPTRSTGGSAASSTGDTTPTTYANENFPPSSVSQKGVPFPEAEPSPAAVAERLAPANDTYPRPAENDMAGRFLAAIARRQTVEEVNDIWRQFRDGPARTLSKQDQTRAGNGYIRQIERLGRMRQPPQEGANDNGS
jgi:hypothetical protein